MSEELQTEFERAYGMARDQSIGFLVCKGTSHEDAEDAYQEATLRLWEYLQGRRGHGYNVSYLDKMLQRVAWQREIDRRRRSGTQNERPLEVDGAGFSVDGIEAWGDRADFRAVWPTLLTQSGYDETTLRILLLYYRYGAQRLGRRMHISERGMTMRVRSVLRKHGQFPLGWLWSFGRHET